MVPHDDTRHLFGHSWLPDSDRRYNGIVLYRWLQKDTKSNQTHPGMYNLLENSSILLILKTFMKFRDNNNYYKIYKTQRPYL